MEDDDNVGIEDADKPEAFRLTYIFSMSLCLEVITMTFNTLMPLLTQPAWCGTQTQDPVSTNPAEPLRRIHIFISSEQWSLHR